MNKLGRRQFIAGSMGTVALGALAGRKATAASDKVVVGVMGVGNRGDLPPITVPLIVREFKHLTRFRGAGQKDVNLSLF